MCVGVGGHNNTQLTILALDTSPAQFQQPGPVDVEDLLILVAELLDPGDHWCVGDGGHNNTQLTILALDTSPATVPATWACRC